MEEQSLTEEKNNLFYIYAIENKINGKKYIGKSAKPGRRWDAHISNSKKISEHHYYIHRALKKYGVNNFWFRTIDFYFDEKESLVAEKYWIAFFKSNISKYGYNLTQGGEGASGFKHTDITRNKLSKLAKGRTAELNSFYGKAHSKQTKSKIRNARRKLEDADILNILHKRLVENKSISELSTNYNISESHLYSICRGKYWPDLYKQVKTKNN